MSAEERVAEIAYKEHKPRYKIGDKVRVTTEMNEFHKGDEFVIGHISKNLKGEPLFLKDANDSWGVTDKYIELVEDTGKPMELTFTTEMPTKELEKIFLKGKISAESGIKDSGERRQFSTGAVRDVQEGKGRCDLLPLKQCAEWSGYKELKYIQKFIDTRDDRWIYSAMTEFVNRNKSGYEEMDFEEVILDVSKHYEEGAKKYKERNWEKGIPLHAYIDSGVRHFLKCMASYDDEPHNRAFIWNMLGAIWTLENRPECDDLPKGEREENEE